MPASVTFKEHERLIGAFAYRVLRRLFAAGVSCVQYEDIVQESTIAWCIARDNWSPEHNVPFTPYMLNGVRLHINRWVSKEIEQKFLAPISMDFDNEDGLNLHEAVPSDDEASDDTLILKEIKDRAMRKFSPNTRKFVELFENSNPELIVELKAIKAKREYARSRGISGFAHKQISAPMIFDLMGLTSQERGQVYKEIRLAAQKVSQ